MSVSLFVFGKVLEVIDTVWGLVLIDFSVCYNKFIDVVAIETSVMENGITWIIALIVFVFSSWSTVVGLSTDPAPLIIFIFFDLGFYGLKASL